MIIGGIMKKGVNAYIAGDIFCDCACAVANKVWEWIYAAQSFPSQYEGSTSASTTLTQPEAVFHLVCTL